MPEKQEWHADKRVPIALILAISIQTGGVIWWAASITEQIKNVASVQQEDRVRITSNAVSISDLDRSEAAMSQRLMGIEASQRRVENNLSEVLRFLRAERQ